jgi:peptide/nickel transport system substrate-binding protein
MTQRHFLPRECRQAVSLSIVLVLALLMPMAALTARAQSEEPKQGGTLTIVQPAEPFSFDSRIDPKMEGIQVVMNVQDPLVSFDPATGELVPSLAESWTVSEDGLEYAFTLRQNVQFSDGSPFTAADVVFTFDFLTGAREGGAYVSQFEPFIESVTAQDDYNVVVAMKQPFPDFLNLVSRLWATRILSQEAVEAAGESYGVDSAVGTGPFMIEEWVKGDRVTMVRNPNYWGEPAYLDEVIYQRVPDGATRLIQAQSGQADVVYQPPLDQLAALEGDPNLRVVSVPGNPIVFLRFNTSAAPFNDTRARQAVSYALDTNALREAMYGEYAQTANDFLPSWHWAHDPAYVAFTRDLERARALLAEAGYTEGAPLTFDLTMNNESEYTQLGTLIQAQLQEVGIQVNLKPLDPATLTELETTNPDEYDATVSRFLLPTGVTDDYMFKQYGAEGPLNRTYLNQPNGYSDPKIERLINEARVTQDQEAAKALYRQAIDRIVAGAVTVPIAFKNNVDIVSTRVHDLHVLGTDAELLHKVWVE